MLIKKVKFGKTACSWDEDQNENIHFMKELERTLNIRVKRYGDIYLNEIYEIIGLEWNTGDKNTCFKCDDNFENPFRFKMFETPNKELLIHIYFNE